MSLELQASFRISGAPGTIQFFRISGASSAIASSPRKCHDSPNVLVDCWGIPWKTQFRIGDPWSGVREEICRTLRTIFSNKSFESLKHPYAQVTEPATIFNNSVQDRHRFFLVNKMTQPHSLTSCSKLSKLVWKSQTRRRIAAQWSVANQDKNEG